MGDPFKVSIRGPLASWLPGFRSFLFDAGYAPDSASQQLQMLAHLSRWMLEHDMEVRQLTSPVIAVFFSERRKTHTASQTPRSLQGFLAFLQDVGVERDPDPPDILLWSQVLLEEFRVYLVAERALAPETVKNYLNQVRPFVSWRSTVTEDEISSLAVNEVLDFLVIRRMSESVGSVKVAASALRVFLRWLFLTGKVLAPLAEGVLPVAYSPYGALPKALTGEQFTAVVDIGVSSPEAVLRDQAMVLLLSRMGLRSNEVACLRLEHFKWEAGTVLVPGKGCKNVRMPLPVDVGEAVVAYLRDERPPSSCRNVFLQSKAPHARLGRAGVSQVVAARAARAGIGFPVRAHRLRHSAATRVLSEGGTLTEAGQLLRHISPTTTLIYAKVHIDALRALAIPWPLLLPECGRALPEEGAS